VLDCVLSIRYCVQCVLGIMCCVRCVLSIRYCARCVLCIRCCARFHLVCCVVGLLRPESRLTVLAFCASDARDAQNARYYFC